MALRTVEPVVKMDGTWMPVAVGATMCELSQVDTGRSGFQWFVGAVPPAPTLTDPQSHGHGFKGGHASPPVDGVATVFVRGPRAQYLTITHDGV